MIFMGKATINHIFSQAEDLVKPQWQERVRLLGTESGHDLALQMVSAAGRHMAGPWKKMTI